MDGNRPIQLPRFSGCEYSRVAAYVRTRGCPLRHHCIWRSLKSGRHGVSIDTADDSGGTWTEKLLYSFPGKNGDGDQPIAPVTIGDGGVLYGTNTEGGDIGLCDHHGCGTVFQLVPPSAPGGAWTETVLTQFLDTSESGSYPYSGITLAPDGALYGATSGNSLLGTIFEIVHQ